MVLLNLLKKPRKLLLLIAVSLSAGLFAVSRVKVSNNNVAKESSPFLGVPSPSLDQVGVLSDSAAPCTTPAPVLVVFVHSAPSHVSHREAIRKTWGSPEPRGLKTVFVVGRSQNKKVRQKVQQEAEEYNDVVLLDLEDSYKNLTLKHLAGMKWVLLNCPQALYVLKADDDAFIDSIRVLSVISTLLSNESGSKDSLICNVIPEGSSPKRSGKWMVSKEEYPYEEYPEYCSGLAYFARTSTLRKLSDTACSGRVPYLTIDDVFVTGLSATLAGVKRQDLGVRFATNEQPVIEWMLSKTVRPCPWMAAEMSSYFWPKEALILWNKTVVSWKKLRHDKTF